jgi:hypothetical protein
MNSLIFLLKLSYKALIKFYETELIEYFCAFPCETSVQYINMPHKCIQHYKMISHSSNIDCLLQTLKSRFVTLTTHYTSDPAVAFADVHRNGF